MSIERCLFLSDIHWPKESKAYDLALHVGESIPNLKHIILNGDVGEFESISSYVKGANTPKLLKEEIDYCNTRLDELEGTFSGLDVTWLLGNHEHRIARFIGKNAIELSFLGITPETLFHINERPSFKIIPYTSRQLYKIAESNLYCRHEPLSGSANHAKQTAEGCSVDVIYGHTHTHQKYTHKRLGPGNPTTTATAIPWLGDETQACFEYRGPKDKWQTGFTVITYDTKSGKYQIDVIIIKDSECFYNGKIYKV